MGVTLADRVRNLEGWRDDIAEEFREWREWMEGVTPFIKMLQADLTYRQARHAEHAAVWSKRAKILATATAVVICLCAIGSFVMTVLTFLSHTH